MTFKKLMGFAFLGMFAISTMTMSSCAKKEGCTFEKSDNYDAEAEEDDGSCVEWAEKFVANYTVKLECGKLIPLNSEFDMSISKTSADEVSLILETAAFGSLPLSGTVVGKKMTFNTLTLSDLTLEAGGGLVITALVIDGGGTMDDTDTNMTGTITIAATTNIGALADTCPMVATRK